MKKTLISAVVALAFINTAHAQTPATGPQASPASVTTFAGTAAGQAALKTATTPVQPGPVESSGQLKPSSTPANPFTGVTKEQELAGRSLADLQAQSMISQQKLKLMRDEIDALKLEVEKKKYLDQLNPPPPPKVSTPQSSTPVVKKKPTKEVKPVEIIWPKQSRNERPELIGVIEASGQKVALVQHDGKSLRAQEGSLVGGKAITQISSDAVQWGGEFISVSGRRGLPSVELTDTDSPKTKKQSPGQITTPPVYNTPEAMNTSVGQRTAPVINPRGATSNSNGSTNPSGILATLPPPPPPIRAR